MQKRWCSIMAAAGLLFALNLQTLRADTYSFTLLPPSGGVGGPPGSVVGWGYSLSNDSTSDWLVTSDLQAGSFLDGSPNSIFDFPDLGPGESLIVPFNVVEGLGLYELVWDSSAAIGLANMGTFALDAQWWSGDPLNGGTFIADAGTTDLNYSAVVTSPVPEPSPLILFVIVPAMLLLVNASGARSAARRA